MYKRQLGQIETIIGDFHSDEDVKNVMKEASSICYIPARFREDEFDTGKRIVDSARDEQV